MVLVRHRRHGGTYLDLSNANLEESLGAQVGLQQHMEYRDLDAVVALLLARNALERQTVAHWQAASRGRLLAHVDDLGRRVDVLRLVHQRRVQLIHLGQQEQRPDVWGEEGE